MSDHVFLYDALHVTPPILESEIAPLIADGTYIRIENTDFRGEPGYLARRRDAAVGVFVAYHHADEDGTTAPAATTIEADPNLEFTKEERPADAVADEVARIMADFRATSRAAVRLFDGVIAYEENTYLGPGPADYATNPKVIAIRAGRPVALAEKEWREQS